ncbi:thiol reductant ABC exporter subunit CydC [Acetobacter okinawensis]|uniref:thiol reductant ABC exporter subunit CydC n=1 Tax=Acetobacter okinawensis TaxID=1076594 RepID=UPI00214D917A|nr:thiol reductant ABC exporter subunit CydC [Acetobacter okinawensis]
MMAQGSPLQGERLMSGWRVFLRLAGAARWRLVWGVVLACAASLASFGLLFLSGWLLAGAAVAGLAGQVSARAFNIILPATGVRFFAMVRILARYMERVVAHDGALRLTGQLRAWVYERLIPLAPAGLMELQGGDMLGRFVSDTDKVAAYYTDVALPFARAALCGVVFVGVFACFLPLAALVLALGLLGGALVPCLIGAATDRLVRRGAEKQSQIQAELAETLQNLGEYLLLDTACSRAKGWQAQQSAVDHARWTLDALEGAARGLVTILTFVTALAVLVLAAHAHQMGQLSVAEIPMLVLGGLAAFEVVTPLPLARQAAAEARLAGVRLQMACAPHGVAEVVQPHDLPHAPYDLVMRDVSFAYPKTVSPVLQHASLSIRQGEHVGLVGPSGVGKSSLINLLFGFYAPCGGSITFGGVDVRLLRAEDMAAFVAVVAQDFHLFAGTLRDNLLLGAPSATDAEVAEVLEVAQLTRFVQSLPKGLQTWVGNDGLRLSGGQARRVAVAQALLRRTPWLVLDEPTEGLDAPLEQALMAAITRWAANTTIVCMTHRTAVLPFMHRVVRVEDARFCPEGRAT